MSFFFQLGRNRDRVFEPSPPGGTSLSMFLDCLIGGAHIGRIVGPESMHFEGWQRLNAEYSKQFGVETTGYAPRQ